MTWFHGYLTGDHIKAKTVLEVGSYNVNGTVRPVVERLEPKTYLGVDASPGPNVDRVVDCRDLVDVFGPGSWDVVISTEMLEHVRDWKDCMRNLVDVVKPGGVLAVTTRSPGFPYHPFPEDHWRYTRVQMLDILERAHMDVVELLDDPEAPGVFALARKSDAWLPWTGDVWADVHPMVQPKQ